MPRLRTLCLLTFVTLLPCLVVQAQQAEQPAAAAQKPPEPAVDFAALVAREFGPDFTLVPKIPPMMLDMNGDGLEDLVLVAGARQALGGSEKFHYTVQDPYGRYFGYSNPTMSMQFSTDPAAARHLLVIEDWKGAKGPKFVLVNIPFDKIRAGNMLLRKKTIEVVETEDEIGIEAAIYWDGKRFHWEAVGMNQSR